MTVVAGRLLFIRVFFLAHSALAAGIHQRRPRPWRKDAGAVLLQRFFSFGLPHTDSAPQLPDPPYAGHIRQALRRGLAVRISDHVQ